MRVENIIGLVPDDLLDHLSSIYKVDYSVKKLQGKIMFKLLLYTFLTSRTISLRIMAAIYDSEKFRNLFVLPKKTIKHSGLGFRFSTINYHYFENIFSHLITSSIVDAVLFADRKIAISKIDSTIVTLSSKLLKVGLDNNPGKKTLKFGVEINEGVPVNIILFKGQSYLSEDNALPELIVRKRQKKALNIAIFDRGVQRKQNFVNFHTHGISFISRLSTQNVRTIRELSLTEQETRTLVLVSDQIVTFANSEGMQSETAATEFRVIIGKNKETGQEIRFLTNILVLSAGEITELYKSRWEIETFFKFIKQELNFRHLLSRNENGIKVVMYMTMITAIILTLYKKVNNIVGWAVAKIKFVDELESWIMHDWRGEITRAFYYPHKQVSFQLRGP